MKNALYIIIGVAVAAGAWWYVAIQNSEAVVDMQGGAAATTTDASAAARTPPSGQLEYRNEQYKFALFYPNNLAVKTYDEGDGASTIIFQNAATVQGFQIFIVPYAGAQVSQERFMQDEPSGVRQSPKDITIDGATGTSFYSANAALGETAEVWFIHNGYLFEVTTLKPLAGWLSQSMATWQFI
jgi:hypothetical protein